MSLINNDIVNSLSAWAKKNENKKSFSQIEKNEKTYYKDRTSKETYIMEYSIKTIKDMKQALEKYSGLSEDPHMLEKMAIGLCQNRYRRNLSVSESVKRNKNEDVNKPLPDSIYLF